jgi:hypothetical protein
VPNVWDASDAVRPDAAADVAHPHRALTDADAERSAGLELDVPAQVVRFPQARLLVQSEHPVAAAELCIPGAVLSAEQSCVAPVVVMQTQPAMQQDAVLPRLSPAEQKP